MKILQTILEMDKKGQKICVLFLFMVLFRVTDVANSLFFSKKNYGTLQLQILTLS